MLILNRIYFFWVVGIFGALISGVAFSSPLDSRDRRELQRMRDQEVVAAIWYQPGAMSGVGQTIGVASHTFSFINTSLVRSPASNVLELYDRAEIRDIEIIDNGLAHGAEMLLRRLEQLHRYRRMGQFPFSAVNLSLSPDRKLINKLPLRTGERTMRRAISAISKELGIPVFMAVGNDGPAEGFVNPWAKAPGVFAVTAADREGRSILDVASRPNTYTGTEDWHLFSAWGVDTVGARDRRVRKSHAELEAEKRINLSEIVGKEYVDFFNVMSGTSFASPNMLSSVCPLHQMIEHTSQAIDATHDLNLMLRPFVRAIVDTSIDEGHPLFNFRLADKRKKYSGLRYQISPQYKQMLYEAINDAGVDLSLRFSSDVAYRYFLKSYIPCPVQEAQLGMVLYHSKME